MRAYTIASPPRMAEIHKKTRNVLDLGAVVVITLSYKVFLRIPSYRSLRIGGMAGPR
jgi:hypothetical protein